MSNNISVTSLSGGKTSSYMALHYPTDYNVFALVTIEAPSDMSYAQIKKVGLQQDFFFGAGSGCQAGYCTD